MDSSQLVLEMGIIMMVAFIGATLASKARQSVIIGYILVGVLIGPFMHISIFGLEYNGLIKDTNFIGSLSLIGLTLLMFFVGLEFSISKLRKTSSPALVLALVNTGLDLFLGLMLGMALGWPLIDTVFLAGVFAMGSAAITGKSLLDMQRMSAPETEFLLGAVVVEDFISMIIMTIAGGLIFKSGSIDPFTFTTMIVGVIVFYAFFIVLAVFLIPRSIRYIQQVRNEEMFVLFALGMLFLSCALAELAGVPAIIGAFFLGMIFSETKLMDRFEKRISPFRDAFVAVFFVSFGMLIDPALFLEVLPIVALAVPLVLLSDLILTSLTAYLLGLNPRRATFVGASMCGRGAESVMFASVGANSVGVSKGSIINPFAGLFCFVMSTITPVLMRFSDRITKALGRLVPSYALFAGSLLNRTMGKVMMPSPIKLFQRTRRLEVVLVAYFLVLLATMTLSGYVQWACFLLDLGIVLYLYRLIDLEFRPIIRTINYDNLGASVRDPLSLSGFISTFLSLTLATILLASLTFSMLWYSCFIVFGIYLTLTLYLMHRLEAVVRSPSKISTDISSSRPTIYEGSSSAGPAIGEFYHRSLRQTQSGKIARDRLAQRHREGAPEDDKADPEPGPTRWGRL